MGMRKKTKHHPGSGVSESSGNYQEQSLDLVDGAGRCFGQTLTARQDMSHPSALTHFATLYPHYKPGTSCTGWGHEYTQHSESPQP